MKRVIAVMVFALVVVGVSQAQLIPRTVITITGALPQDSLDVKLNRSEAGTMAAADSTGFKNRMLKNADSTTLKAGLLKNADSTTLKAGVLKNADSTTLKAGLLKNADSTTVKNGLLKNADSTTVKNGIIALIPFERNKTAPASGTITPKTTTDTLFIGPLKIRGFTPFVIDSCQLSGTDSVTFFVGSKRASMPLR